MAAPRPKSYPNYDQEKVEAELLRTGAELHPTRPTAEALIAKIIADPEDKREVATAELAIAGMREFELLNPRDDGLVELTPAALRAVALLCQ